MSSALSLTNSFVSPAQSFGMVHALTQAQNPLWRMTRALFDNPMFDNPMARAMGVGAFAGMAAVGDRLTRSYKDPGFNIEGLREETILKLPFCDVIRFHKDDGKYRRPMLIVAPMSGHYASLLRDTVEGLSVDHDVCITNWKCASEVCKSHGAFTLDTYIAYVAHIIRHFEGDVHTLGISQSGVPLLAAISLLEASDDKFSPKSMTIMASPIDVTRNPTRMNKLTKERDISWFRNHVIAMGASGRDVYPGKLQQMGIASLDPQQFHDNNRALFNAAAKGDRAAEQRHDAENNDHSAVMDLDAAFYLQTIQSVFLNHDLPRGRMVYTDSSGKQMPVLPSQIRKCALFTVEGKKDPIVGHEQTHATHDLCSSLPASKRARHCIDGAKHYFFRGDEFKALAPKIASFTAAHHGADNRLARDRMNLPECAPAF